jgi:hypothetical protein
VRRISRTTFVRAAEMVRRPGLLQAETDAGAFRSLAAAEWHGSDRFLARIIHECRREAAETEARRGFSQVRTTQAYLRSVEETEREKPRRARGSAAVVGNS